MIQLLPKYMIVSLTFTIVIELIIGIILNIKEKKDLLNIILVNVLTNPLVVSISLSINAIYGLNYRNISLIILEISAFFIEGVIYKKTLIYKKFNPFILSLKLNASSYLIGTIINNFW